MVRKVNNIYAICAFAAIGGGLFGFDISSMSGVLGTNAYKNYFGNPQGSQVCLYFSNPTKIEWSALTDTMANSTARRNHLRYACRLTYRCIGVRVSRRQAWS